MPIGPGKYDDALTRAREETGGSAILIVLDGKRGSSFCVQATPEHTLALPALLELTARRIRESFAQGNI